MMKLEEFAEINMGQSPVSSSYNENEDGLPFFQGKADFGKINPKAKVWCNKPTKIAEKDDILMSVRAPVGDLNIATAKCCIGRGLAGIRAKKDKCYFKYLFYFLRSKYNELNQMSTGSTFKAISKNNILNIEGNIPEIKEQKIIVSKLDKFQDLIIKTEEQIELLDDLIKSQFVEMFGDPVLNEKQWKKTHLGDECNIITGNTPSRNKKEYYGDFIEWIKSDNVNTPSNYITQAKEYLSEEGEKVGRTINANSILMTCIAGSISCIGNVAMTDRKVAFNQQINGIETLKNNVIFMYIQFLLSKEYIQSTINMSLKGILSKGKLSELEFIFPPIELQNQFADIVKQIDKQKFEIQNELIELKKVKEYLMNKYFN